MTALDQTTPTGLAAKQVSDLRLAIAAAATSSPTSGAEFLADFAAGVGGLSFDLPDAYALDVELNRVEAERAGLVNELSVLRDHVKELESGTRDALAIDWDSLRDAVAAIPGIPAPAIAAVMAAFHKAVTP